MNMLWFMTVTCFILKLQWGQNIELMYDRILRHPDRVRNMYFTYLFVLRAVTKVSKLLYMLVFDMPNLNNVTKLLQRI